MKRIVLLLTMALAAAAAPIGPASAAGEAISTVAGPEAQLSHPGAVVLDRNGNTYIADTNNHRIRKLSADGTTITTIAGTGTEGSSNGNGSPTSTQLRYPSGLAVDQAGNVYIADTLNHRIRKLSADGTTITTIAGTGTEGSSNGNGSPTTVQLSRPNGLALDAAGNLYIADTNNHRIRKLSADGTTITTIAGTTTHGNADGNGIPTNVQLNFPHSVAVDAAGNVYFADTFNHRVRKLNAAGTAVTTIIGTGNEGRTLSSPTQTRLRYPWGVAVDRFGNVFVSDTVNHRILRLDDSGSLLSVIADSGASLQSPRGIHVVDDGPNNPGRLFIADTSNHRIRELPLPNERVLLGDYANASGTRGSVARLYMAVFGRQPDAEGFVYWTGRVSNGLKLEKAAESFVSSPEFIALYGSTSNAEFVDLLYVNVLGRPADAEGRGYWIGQLGSGMSRTELTLWFSESPEFKVVTETS